MASCNFWGTARLNFETTSIQHFLADLFLIHGDTEIIVNSNTLYFPPKNVEGAF